MGAPTVKRRAGDHGSSAVRRRVARGDRGAALVEFGIVAVLLLGLVFGVIDYGNYFYEQAAQRNGTQQAARFLAVGNHGTCTGATPNDKIICYTKQLIGGDPTDVRVYINLVDTYAKGSAIILCSERQQTSLTGFYQPFLDGYSRTVAYVRIESPNTADEPVTGGDVAFSGSWAWCA